MNMSSLLALLGGGSVITYILGWLGGRKESDAELEHTRLKNIKDSIDIYNRIHQDMREQMDEVSTRCIKLSTDIDIFRKENKRLENNISVLSSEIDLLREENIGLKREISELKDILEGKNK